SDEENASFTIAEEDLSGGNGITAAIGVEAGTVTQPSERQENFMLDGVPLLLVGAALLLSAGGAAAVLAMVRRHRRDTTQSSTRYGIPGGWNRLLANGLTGQENDRIVAMILHLAVNGVLRIEDPEQQADKKSGRNLNCDSSIHSWSPI